MLALLEPPKSEFYDKFYDVIELKNKLIYTMKILEIKF